MMNTQDYPTVWAYEQACKALADAKEQLAAKDAELQAALKRARKDALLEAANKLAESFGWGVSPEKNIENWLRRMAEGEQE